MSKIKKVSLQVFLVKYEFYQDGIWHKSGSYVRAISSEEAESSMKEIATTHNWRNAKVCNRENIYMQYFEVIP